MIIKKKCLVCDKPFKTKTYQVKMGNGKYCSRVCSVIGKKRNHIPPNNNFICRYCKKPFHDKPSSKRTYCSINCMAKGYKQILKNKNNPHWRGGYITKYCQWCGKKIYLYPSNIKKGYGRFCSTSCSGDWKSKFKSGANSHLWKGGDLLKNRYLGRRYWYKIRNRIYKRDNFTCQICDKTDVVLNAHHIIPYRISQDDSENNLITLCVSCHSKEEHKYYKNIKGGVV